MKRRFALGSVVASLLALAVLSACSTQDGPMLGALVVDVAPDGAHVIVTAGNDLINDGYGDVELRDLEPGTYGVTARHGAYAYTASIEVSAREVVTASIQLGEPSTMHLTYQHGPLAPPPLTTLRHGEPGGGGNGNGNGNGNGSGNGNPGGKSGKGDVYGDLWVLDRYPDGAPTMVVGLDASGDPVLVDDEPFLCVQPISSQPSETEEPNLITLIVSTDGPAPKCEPLEEDVPYLQEVEFGRLNLVRSPPSVLEHAYTEAMATLTGASSITTGPAGRLVAVLADGTEQTIDSPLENVALYQALLRSGMGSADGAMSLPGVTLPRDPLDIAASLFAGGADKSGRIDLDEVVYIDEFLGLNVDAEGDPYYAHFNGYHYDRASLYSGVTATILVPVEGSPGTYQEQTVDIYEYFFDSTPADPDLVDDAQGFATAADDALQVIVFVHDNGVR